MALTIILTLQPGCLFGLHLVSSTTLNGSANSIDRGFSITTDSSGNAWAIGDSSETVGANNIWIGKYNSSLVLLSSVTVDGARSDIEGVEQGFGITVDPSSNVWVTGFLNETVGRGGAIWIAKYNSSLVLLSSTTHDPSDTIDSGEGGIKVDASGNVWVCGTAGEDLISKIWVGKYNSSLVFQSSVTIDGGAGTAGNGFGLDLDSNGNVWATGYVWKSGDTWPNTSIWIGKYNPSLVLQASTTVNGSANDLDSGMDLTVDSSGNVYVVGRITQNGTGSDIWIGKYSSTLVLLSSTTFSSSGNNADEALDVATDANGNIWVTGFVTEGTQGRNIWIASYNSSLILKSSTTVNGSLNDSDEGQGIAIHQDGSVWVIGFVKQTGGGFAATIAHDIWVGRYNLLPEVPGSFAGTALGVSSISWSWGNQDHEDGFRIIDTGNLNKSGDLPANTLSWAETGLSTNTVYSRKIAAFNAWGASTSTAVSRYTLAMPPAATSVTSVSSTSINLTWTPNTNPSGTSYQVHYSTSSDFAASSTTLLTSTPTQTAVQSLAPFTTYYLKVRALNGDDIATVFDGFVSTRTGSAPVPPIPSLSASALGVSSVSWSWGDVTGEEGYRVLSLSDANLSGNLAANTAFWNETGLSTNVAYSRAVAAFNIWGASTSTPVTRYTLAAPPAGFALVQVNISSISVSWGANTNPAGTLYRLDFWQPGGSTTTATQTATNAIITGLSSGSTYYLSVRAMNGDGIPTAPDITLSTVTKTPLSVVEPVDPETGKRVIFNPPQGPVEVNIPPQAFKEPIVITVQVPASFPDAASLTAEVKGTGVGVEITLDKNIQPARDVTISVSYKDATIGDVNEDQLVLARFDQGANVWVSLVSIPDPSNRRVTGRTNHFSTFQIMQVTPSNDLSAVKVFPNPLRPTQGHSSMTFSNLPPNTRIRIYSLLGELIKDLATNAAGMAGWDGANEAGVKVASGVYLVFVGSGIQNRTFKVAVQR